MDTPFLGMLMMAGFNFAPRGWAFCNGQLLSIAQNTALFSLLGTTYGGDGRVTFGLPDLRGRVPMHWGQGPGLTNRDQGEVAGNETVTLLSSQMPQHTHNLYATNAVGDSSSPSGNLLADTGGLDPDYKTGGSVNVTMNPTSIGLTGGSQPHDNMQPYLTVTFCIALEGIYPSRN